MIQFHKGVTSQHGTIWYHKHDKRSLYFPTKLQNLGVSKLRGINGKALMGFIAKKSPVHRSGQIPTHGDQDHMTSRTLESSVSIKARHGGLHIAFEGDGPGTPSASS